MALALAGCGSDSPVTTEIDFKSPAVKDGVTNPNVLCGWGSIWIPLEWGAVPEETKELAVYIGRYKYVNDGGTRKLVSTFGELISHIKPSVKGVPANVLPEGADWSNTNPVSCPLRKDGQRLLLGLIALDQVRPRHMTQPLATRLTEEALGDLHPGERPRSPGTLTSEAAGAAWFTTDYTGTHAHPL